MAVSLLQSQLGTDSRRPSALSPPDDNSILLSQSSAGCHLWRASSWSTAVFLPREEQQSPSQALSTVQEASRVQLATEPGEPHWPVLSLISWHTSGSSRLVTNWTSNNEGSRTMKPTQMRNSSQRGVVGAVSLCHSPHKVSRCLWCDSCCITTLPLPFCHCCSPLLTLPDATRQSQGHVLTVPEQSSRAKLLLTRSQSYVEYWHNGSKKTAQWDTEELKMGSVYMNLIFIALESFILKILVSIK